MPKPICVELFAGAGIASVGISKNFDILAAVELDSIAAATHRLNFPECTLIEDDVCKLDACDIRSRSRIKDREIDFVWASPPCQSFSLESRSVVKADDSRSELLLEACKLIVNLRPRYFAIENVKGLTQGRCKPFLEEAIDYLQRHNYKLLEPKVLNAKYYGVPQSRERVIILGSRNDVPLPTYPLPSEKLITVGEAIADLPEASNYEELWERDWAVARYSQPSEYACKLRTNPCLLTYSWRTKHSEEVIKRFADTKPGTRDKISRFFRPSLDGQCNTLKAGSGSYTATRPIHPTQSRVMTIRELARIQGIPDDFFFANSILLAARQIGNSVPPPLVEAIVDRLITDY